MCVKSKHLPLLPALKFPFLVHLYAAFLFDQVVQRTWAVPERHLLVRIFHHPENMANMFLITYLKNKAVSLYCTGEEHIHLNLNCSLCPFQANSKRVFTPVKPALKSILFYFVNSSDFDFHTNTIIVLTSQTYFRDFFFLQRLFRYLHLLSICICQTAVLRIQSSPTLISAALTDAGYLI